MKVSLAVRNFLVTVIFVLVADLFCLPVQSYASEYSSGSSSVLGVGRSVRSAALGSASSALGGAGSDALWNPALLARLDRHSVSVSHLRLFESSELNAVSWGGGFDNLGSFGASVLRFGAEPFARVSGWTPTGESIEYSTFRVTAGYARTLGDHIDIGLNGVVVAEELLDSRDAGFGLDAGVLFSSEQLSLSALVRNLLAPELRLGSRGESLNRIAIVGASYERFRISEEISLTAAVDVRFEEALDPTGHVGLEVGVADHLYLRGGLNAGEVTFGAGIPFGGTTFDYAYESLGDLDASHRFGFSVGFGKTKSERRAALVSRRESVGKAYAAHDRQARAHRAYLSAQAFSEADQVDSSIVYYQIALALQPEHRASLLALESAHSRRVAIHDSLAHLAELELESRSAGSDLSVESGSAGFIVVERLIELEHFGSAEKALLSLGAARGVDSDRMVAVGEKLEVEREKWRTATAGLARSAERSGETVNAFEYYSALNREFANDESYRVALADLAGRLKSKDLVAQAEEAFAAKSYRKARSALGAALALDPENAEANDLLARLEARSPDGGLEEISLNPADWARMSEALRLVRGAEFEQALALFNELLLKYPDNSEILRNKAQVELRLNRSGADE